MIASLSSEFFASQEGSESVDEIVVAPHSHNPKSAASPLGGARVAPWLSQDESLTSVTGLYPAPRMNKGPSNEEFHSFRLINLNLPEKTPTKPAPRERYRLLSSWEGYIVSIAEDSFVARVTNEKNHSEVLDAEFGFEEVNPVDRDLLQEGAIFYWSIGYHDSVSGSRYRSSTLKFRRLPIWTAREIIDAQEKGAALASLLATEATTDDSSAPAAG